MRRTSKGSDGYWIVTKKNSLKHLNNVAKVSAVTEAEQSSKLPGKNKNEEVFAVPQTCQSTPPPLSLPHQIFCNKLLALSKNVTVNLSSGPAVLIVDVATLKRIVLRPPRTDRELCAIPGVRPFGRACNNAGFEHLRNIESWRVKDGDWG